MDQLPGDVHDVFAEMLVRSLERNELLPALRCVIGMLLRDVDGVEALAARIERQLRLLTTTWVANGA